MKGRSAGYGQREVSSIGADGCGAGLFQLGIAVGRDGDNLLTGSFGEVVAVKVAAGCRKEQALFIGSPHGEAPAGN